VEQSVAATKTYTAQLTAMALLASCMGEKTQLQDEVQQLPEIVSRTLSMATPLAERAERYRYMEQCVIIGRGYNYATSFELALKLKELTYVMANAYSSADFRHGPIATVSEGLPVVLIMPGGAAFDDMYDLAHELQSRGAELLIVSDVPKAQELATTLLPIAGQAPEWLSPFAAIVPGQVLALRLALAKGLNPDAPRGLQKVTRTL
jgi:glucosamine--fructose-6-phosphate aminotransferase (isomerizing)